MTVGPFSTMDPLFPGDARDWKLYTTQEVMHLKSVGVLTPFTASGLSTSALLTQPPLAQALSAPSTLGVPKMGLGSPIIEPDSSSKRHEGLSS